MWTKEARIQHVPRQERYPSDMTDMEWAIIAPLIPPQRPGGRHRETDMREAMNAVRYVLRTGCQWRQLPKDFPPRSTVYNYFWEWTRYGVLDRIHHILLVKVREMEGREASPTAAIIDTQAVKATEKGGLRGIRSDTAAKKTKGIKRNVIVDTIGLLLGIAVIPADIQDRDCAANLIARRVVCFHGLQNSLPMAAMLEQSSKPHSLANRSNWKSSNARTTKAASRWYVDGGSSSEHYLGCDAIDA